MTPIAIDFFYEHAGHVLRPYMAVEPATPDDHCGVCDRPNADWADPASKVSFTQYGQHEDHCLSCHSLFQGSEELFGIERMASGSPVPMKLGMATGCGALVTSTQTTLFLNGFIKKMSKAPAPPFEMVEMSGLRAHQYLVANIPEEEFLYIGDFGRKKKGLVANLHLSNPQELFICSENECLEVSVPMAKALLASCDTVPDIRRRKVKKVLQDLYTGQITPDNERLQAEMDLVKADHSEIVQALSKMPDDPRACLNTLKLW